MLALVVIIGGIIALRRAPSGPVLWTMELTETSTALFVDAPARRAFVLTVPAGIGGADHRPTGFWGRRRPRVAAPAVPTAPPHSASFDEAA